MENDKNIQLDKDYISDLMKNLNSFTNSINLLEGNLKSEDQGSLDSTSQSRENIYYELGNLRGQMVVLQEKLKEADYKVSLEQEFSSTLQGEIGSLQEKEKMLNEQLDQLGTQILQKSADKKKLDDSIKKKENMIEALTNKMSEMDEQFNQLKFDFDEMKSHVSTLAEEIAEKESYIQDQNTHINDLDDKIKGLTEVISIKDDLIIKKDQDLEGVREKLDDYVEKEKNILKEITGDEKFIMFTLGENNKNMGYRALLSLCEEKFDGLRLVLKKMKEKGIVDYDGMLPGFNSEITLLKDL